MASGFGHIVKENGGWRNIIARLSTALTPMGFITKSIEQPNNLEDSSRFLSNVILPKNNSMLISGMRKEESVRASLEFAQQISKEAKNKLNSIRQVIYGSGVSILKSFTTDGKSQVLSKSELKNINKNHPDFKNNKNTAIQSRQSALFAEKTNTPGTLEHGLFDIYNHPEKNGKIHAEYARGWDGFIDSIKSLPTPSEYQDDRHSILMGYTVINNKGYLGASIGVCEQSENATLEYMLKRAQELGLKIPARPDGKEWQQGQVILGMTDEEEAVERDIFKSCLIGKVNSPFVVSKDLKQESSILIKDKNIINLEKVSPNMTVNGISNSIRKWKENALEVANRRIEFASSPEDKANANLFKSNIQGLKTTFSGYLKNKIEAVRNEEMMFDKKIANQHAGIQTENNHLLSDMGYNIGQDHKISANFADHDDAFGNMDNGHAFTPFEQNNKSEIDFYTANKLGLTLTPKNTSIMFSDGVMSLNIMLGDIDRQTLGMPGLNTITNDDSIPLKYLTPGHYKSQGEKGASVVVDDDGLVHVSGVSQDYKSKSNDSIQMHNEPEPELQKKSNTFEKELNLTQ